MHYYVKSAQSFNQVNPGSDNFSFIGGSGYQNHIVDSATNIASCNFIAGGFSNHIIGSCASAILGGSGNTIPDGFHHAGVFGQNINSAAAMASNTFHVNCLNACDTPLFTGGAFPSGTIFKSNGPLPFGALPLYIVP